MQFLILMVYIYVLQRCVHAQVSGDIRIVSGTSISGRLEVYHSGQWGTVCDDHFDDDDARVACRQLGYSSGKTGGNLVKDGSEPTWLDDLECTGSESKLSDCNHAGWGTENCGHSEDVGIICTDSGKLNGNWGCWSPWGDCSYSCGEGTKTRQRQCDNPAPSNGGLHCSGDSTENMTCNTVPCPVNGNWSSWSNWTECSEFCGGGLQERSRSCNNPTPSYGGVFCEGSPKEVILCNKFKCSENSSKYTAAVVGGVAVASMILAAIIILTGQYFFPRLRIMKGSCTCFGRGHKHENSEYEDYNNAGNAPTQSYDNIEYTAEGNKSVLTSSNTSNNRSNRPTSSTQDIYENT